MIKGSKICGISDSKTLNYIINHQYPPQFIGFICNYSKSKRYVEFNMLKKLISIEKKNSKFVAVLVKPNNELFSFVSIVVIMYIFILFFIYLSTPYDFYWQLDSSAARVIKTLSFSLAFFGLYNLNNYRI